MNRKDILIKTGISVGSATIASLVTWVVANRKLNAAYEARLAAELKMSVEYILTKQNIEGIIVSDEDPDDLVDRLNEVEEPIDIVVAELDEVDGERVFTTEEEKPPLEDLARNQKTRYDKISTPDVDETSSIFDEPAEPVEPRPENPDIVVISQEEFMENTSEFEQETLTYFSDDGVINSAGDFFEDQDTKIGAGKPQFGELSNDKNVVYVRNIKLEREYEILWDPGVATDFLMHSLEHMYTPDWRR